MPAAVLVLHVLTFLWFSGWLVSAQCTSRIYAQGLKSRWTMQVIIMAIFLWNTCNSVSSTAFQGCTWWFRMGQSLHSSLSLWNAADRVALSVLCLPVHTTRIVQRLGRTLFKPSLLRGKSVLMLQLRNFDSWIIFSAARKKDEHLDML